MPEYATYLKPYETHMKLRHDDSFFCLSQSVLNIFLQKKCAKTRLGVLRVPMQFSGGYTHAFRSCQVNKQKTDVLVLACFFSPCPALAASDRGI